MKKNVDDMEEDEIFNDVEFNRNEIMGTDETFFNAQSSNNNQEESLDLDKEESSVNSDKLDICDKSMEEEMNKVTLNNKSDKNKQSINHKLTKEDLNTIPLPIFDCIYCAKEKVVFNHLINEEMSLKYLYNAGKKDISLINALIQNNLIEMKEGKNINLKNILLNKNININQLHNLIRVILDNTEYINKFYDKNDSFNFLKQKRKRSNSSDQKKLEIKNDVLDYDNKKYGKEKGEIFEDDSGSSNNSGDKYEKINQITQQIIDNENKDIKDKKIDKSIEEKMCDSFNKLFNDSNDSSFMDLRRKIKWSDIEFEDKPYNVWEVNSIDGDECVESEEDL